MFWKRIVALFRAEELSRNPEVVNEENRESLHMLAIAGLPLSVANIFAQQIVVGRPLFSLWNLLLPLYFLLLLLFETLFLKGKPVRALELLYLFEAPVLLLTMLLGTVGDPHHLTATFFMFLVLSPVFLLDRPGRILSYQLFWSVLFAGMCRFTKDESLFLTDLIHLIEFYLISLSVTLLVIRTRLANLRGREHARYLLEHDASTGMLNRRGLESRTKDYLGKPVTLLLVDLDQLRLFNDFYGHQAGDAVIRSTASILSRCFGPERVFSYGGDELLCVSEDLPERDLGQLLSHIRIQMHRIQFEGNSIPATCAAGYAIGVPATEEDFRGMIRLADIHTHNAKKKGMDQTEGGPYDQERLRTAIIDSNLSIHNQAYETNQLTGLPSLSYFISRVNDILQFGVDMNREPVVGYFNVRRLRSFNDRFGYAQGDALIRQAARVLKDCFPRRHLCYITSGRFGIFCYRDEVDPALERVNAALRDFKPGFPMYSLAGFAHPGPGETAISMLDRAKLAHDSIRRHSDVTYRFYDEQLDNEVKLRQHIIRHLPDALENNWIQVYYQPIARTITGLVCNEEALSRWDDPDFGFLTPERFIPVLEEARLLYRLNLYVVQQILRDFDAKKAAGRPLVPVSVNLSRYDLEQCDMVSEITRLVDEAGYPHSMLAIEITESAFMQDQELLRREVSRFRAGGFQVWIDDFGSEYSTLNLLMDMDFDLIKIDMQFMRDFAPNSKSAIIVADIVDMARRMGVVTLIEGVETETHYRTLRRLGCEKLQGYFFNKPNSMEYILERARKGDGLGFEDPAAGAYYGKIGQLDLAAPLTGLDGDPKLAMSGEMPAGVLEYRDGLTYLLRYSQRFFLYLRERAMLPPRGNVGRIPLLSVPEDLMDAIRRCGETEEWIKLTTRNPADSGLDTFLMRRVSSNPGDNSTALLIVQLPRRQGDA